MSSQMPSRSEWLRYTMEREQMRRRTVPNPSPETLTMWAIKDQKDRMVLQYYLREEANETPNIKITSEVKLK